MAGIRTVISASTSSRRCSIVSADNASRFSRSSGSVFDGRTLKCQSGYSNEMPSRCDTRSADGPNRSFSSCSFNGTSATVELISPEMWYRSRNGASSCDSFCPLREISSSITSAGTMPVSQ